MERKRVFRDANMGWGGVDGELGCYLKDFEGIQLLTDEEVDRKLWEMEQDGSRSDGGWENVDPREKNKRIKEIRELKEIINLGVVSWDEMNWEGDNDKPAVEDLVSDGVDTEGEALSRVLIAQLNKVMIDLNSEQKSLLKKRLGFEEEGVMSLEDLGKDFGWTRNQSAHSLNKFLEELRRKFEHGKRK